MNKLELLKIESMANAAIIAPAGHGKTEMVVEMIAAFSGKQLVLTHTNAGVDAIQKRINKYGVSTGKCSVMTIAAFCMRWVYAYHWTADIDMNLSSFNRAEQEKYYSQLYSGALNLLSHGWVGDILKASYTGVIVDEYQDCTLIQHSIIKQINEYLPVKVLGDPLQGIFGFKDPIVDWNNLGYEIINVETYPWRWKKTNPVLGEYLSRLRKLILPTLDGEECSIEIRSTDGFLKTIAQDSFNGYALLPEIRRYNSVLFLTKWEREQLEICHKMPGIFQQDEKQDCVELFKYAETFDNYSGVQLLLAVLKFVSLCATQVSAECGSYIKRLESGSMDFSRIRKNPELGILLQSLGNSKTHSALSDALRWFMETNIFKFYRSELYREMLRCIALSKSREISFYDSARLIRSDLSLQKRYTDFKYLSSRTLLSKGLEFDCVIIDTCRCLTAKEFYVAMTRAKQMVYVIISQPTLVLKP